MAADMLVNMPIRTMIKTIMPQKTAILGGARQHMTSNPIAVIKLACRRRPVRGAVSEKFVLRAFLLTAAIMLAHSPARAMSVAIVAKRRESKGLPTRKLAIISPKKISIRIFKA